MERKEEKGRVRKDGKKGEGEKGWIRKDGKKGGEEKDRSRGGGNNSTTQVGSEGMRLLICIERKPQEQ